MRNSTPRTTVDPPSNTKFNNPIRNSRYNIRIPHLLLGIILVSACGGGFVLMSLRSDHRQPVLALARPVSIGHRLVAEDLRRVDIATDVGVPVVHAEAASTLVGHTMSTNLPSGTLLTPETVKDIPVPPGQAIAALALGPGQFPTEISPGTHVMVIRLAGDNAAPSDAWPAVVINTAVSANDQKTVASVQLPETAARQVAAIPAGQVSLIMMGGDQR